MAPTIFELWFMETENWVTETGKPNTPLDSLPNLDITMDFDFVSKLKLFLLPGFLFNDDWS